MLQTISVPVISYKLLQTSGDESFKNLEQASKCMTNHVKISILNFENFLQNFVNFKNLSEVL